MQATDPGQDSLSLIAADIVIGLPAPCGLSA